MKIGCMVWRIDRLDLDFWEQIEWIKKNGFEEVSFHACKYLSGNGKGIEPDINNKNIIRRLKKALNGFAYIEIHAPFDNYDVSLVSPNLLIRKTSIKTLEKTIIFAREIKADIVTFHTGTSRAAMDRKEYRRGLFNSLIELDKIAGKSGIKLGAELTSDYELLEKASLKNTGLTIDTGHISFNNGAGYKEFGTIGGLIERFADRAFHLHIHDYDGESDHLPLGKGNIDFDNIIASLKKIGYKGSLCLELNPDRSSVEDILKSKDMLNHWLEGRKIYG